MYRRLGHVSGKSLSHTLMTVFSLRSCRYAMEQNNNARFSGKLPRLGCDDSKGEAFFLVRAI